MAVVQISKIQQRRGQKLLSGMPQLSSAELAWAVDTQELFIGNGSITEGAPYVGNTRVLTEHDNILELAGSYKFAEPDVSITASIFRSLQSKLDEIQVLKGELPMEVSDLEDEITGLNARQTRIEEEINGISEFIEGKKSMVKDSEALIAKYEKQSENVKNNVR
jgi:chromosome segregation ATPase